MDDSLKNITRYAVLLLLFLGVFLFQYTYDEHTRSVRETESITLAPSSFFVKSFDLGLHGALAGYFWLFEGRDAIVELVFKKPDLQPATFNKFFSYLKLVNVLDPKFSTPYIFTTVVLPVTNYPDRYNATIEIGKRGIAEADTNWQIPFYLAATYQLYLGDRTNAAKYFDLAAQTPGIPDQIKRFAINYGIEPILIDKTRSAWLQIYETSNDSATKDRAKLYIEHFDLIKFLNTAIETYRTEHGVYPKTLNDLVIGGVLRSIPPDPLGFQFQTFIENDTTVIGIKKPLQ